MYDMNINDLFVTDSTDERMWGGTPVGRCSEVIWDLKMSRPVYRWHTGTLRKCVRG